MGRIAVLCLLVGCGHGARPFSEPAEVGTACSRAAGEEQCSAEVLATRDGDDFTLEATLSFPGYTLGFDAARLRIEGTIQGADVRIRALDAPVGFVCTMDEVHDDHCHWRVSQERACTASAAVASVTVDAVSDDGIALRFDAEIADEVPGCCTNSCSDSPMAPEADPSGPFRVTGAVNARWQ